MTSPEPDSLGLRVDMTAGKASDAKTADGDAPVFAYIASLPQSQRSIAIASSGELDEAQLASWIEQAATMPFETAQQRRLRKNLAE